MDFADPFRGPSRHLQPLSSIGTSKDAGTSQEDMIGISRSFENTPWNLTSKMKSPPRLDSTRRDTPPDGMRLPLHHVANKVPV